MAEIDIPGLIFFDLQDVIDQVAEESSRRALKSAEEARQRRVLLAGIRSGVPASELVVSLRRGQL